MKGLLKNSMLSMAAVMLSLLSVGCLDGEGKGGAKTVNVEVQLAYPAGFAAQEGVTVVLSSQQNGTFDAQTNAAGVAEFTILPGIYSVAATDVRAENGVKTVLSGSISQVTVPAEGAIVVDLTASSLSQIIIKEMYNGGCLDNDGKNFQVDKSVVLYNNSEFPASLKGLCFGMLAPYNSNATNNYYSNGKLAYDLGDNSWLPAIDTFWTFGDTNETIAPYEKLVVAIQAAIDHTKTVNNSINLGDASYWVCYDPEVGYNNPSYHPAPSENIPTSHYLKSYPRIGTGNSWPLSVVSPAFFIFKAPEDVNLYTFCENTENQDYTFNAKIGCYKIPTSWIFDGMEVFAAANDKNQKRMTASVDAGYVELTNYNGYTLYRNVDKEATEALEENAGKIVYGYSLGTENQPNGSTDPSGIDAEASIAAGAHIIYKDTNNSSNDFHQRSRSSLKK